MHGQELLFSSAAQGRQARKVQLQRGTNLNIRLGMTQRVMELRSRIKHCLRSGLPLFQRPGVANTASWVKMSFDLHFAPNSGAGWLSDTSVKASPYQTLAPDSHRKGWETSAFGFPFRQPCLRSLRAGYLGPDGSLAYQMTVDELSPWCDAGE